jgi:S-methylmethionine-dependent homocysteine/selenocysteine methylase
LSSNTEIAGAFQEYRRPRTILKIVLLGCKFNVYFQENGLTCHGECVSTIIEPVLASEEVVAVGCNCTAPDYVEGVLHKLQALRGKKSLVVYANSGEKWLNKK